MVVTFSMEERPSLGFTIFLFQKKKNICVTIIPILLNC